MDERYSTAAHYHFSPGINSPYHSIRSSASLDKERYLAELLAERQKLGPFLQVLPFCSRLLNQEIVRASSLGPNQSFVDSERNGQNSPMRLAGHHANGGLMDVNGSGWSGMQIEENGHLQRMEVFRTSTAAGWNATPISAKPVLKKVLRMDIPVDKYPNFNFIGRLLGPRGNSLRRVEATTQCRVFIRGRGSIKDSVQEENLRGKPGFEHLNEPLHVLLEAEFPADVIDARLKQAVDILEDLLKPMDESMDYYKKSQLRELAILNGNLREESPHRSPAASPFNCAGMKRAKTGV